MSGTSSRWRRHRRAAGRRVYPEEGAASVGHGRHADRDGVRRFLGGGHGLCRDDLAGLRQAGPVFRAVAPASARVFPSRPALATREIVPACHGVPHS